MHFLLHCKVLDSKRSFYVEKLQTTLEDARLTRLINDDDLMKLILTPRRAVGDIELLIDLERISRYLIFTLHNERSILMGGVSCYRRKPQTKKC